MWNSEDTSTISGDGEGSELITSDFTLEVVNDDRLEVALHGI